MMVYTNNNNIDLALIKFLEGISLRLINHFKGVYFLGDITQKLLKIKKKD